MKVKELPSLKKRSKKVYVFLVLYSILSLFIVVESALPGSVSGAQSGFFSDIIAYIINIFTGGQTPSLVEPETIVLESDSSYLGEGKIALGSSSRLTFRIEYPEADSYRQDFEIERIKGGEGEYQLTIGSAVLDNNLLYQTVNVIGLEVGEYQFNFRMNEELFLPYSFSVVDLPAPEDFVIGEVPNTLSVGESCYIPLYLTDPDNKLSGRLDTENMNEEERKIAVDHYLRRIYDPEKLDSHIPSGLSLTNDGILTATQSGTYKCWIGDETHSFIVNVIDDGIVSVPTDFSLETSGRAYLNDYDYYLEDDFYGFHLDGVFSNSSDNQFVSFTIKNDDNSYGQLRRIDANSVYVLGYRKLGTIVIEASSPLDSSIKHTIEVQVEEAMPESFSLNIGSEANLEVGSYLRVNGLFSPLQTANRGLTISENTNPEVVSISGNSSSTITIRGEKEGTTTLTFISAANPSLSARLTLNIESRHVINDDNASSFHQSLRKFIGHFSLFAIDAIFGFFFFFYYLEGDKRRWWLTLASVLFLSLFMAGLTELLQLLVPERGPSFYDAGIDFLGAVCGLVLIFLIYLLIYYIRRKKEKK